MAAAHLLIWAETSLPHRLGSVLKVETNYQTPNPECNSNNMHPNSHIEAMEDMAEDMVAEEEGGRRRYQAQPQPPAAAGPQPQAYNPNAGFYQAPVAPMNPQ
jgi:hypothetical protein